MQEPKTRIYFTTEAPFPTEYMDVVASYNITKRDYENMMPHMEVKDGKGSRHVIVKEFIASVSELGVEDKTDRSEKYEDKPAEETPKAEK